MIASYVIAGILLLIALGCAHGIFHWLRQARALSRWPTVPGKITSSWESLDTGKIQYSYSVNGRPYIGKRIVMNHAGKSTFDRTPQEITETYPPGATVTVYYDPKRPSAAVLEPLHVSNLAGSVVFAAAFGFFGVLVLSLALFRS
jgi:hypothetical protein